MMDTLQPTRVRCYWNSNEDVWSVQTKGKDGTWRVAMRLTKLYLTDCRWHINEGGRADAQRRGHKRQHAYVEGSTMAYDPYLSMSLMFRTVYYNPRSTLGFHVKLRKKRVEFTRSDYAILMPDGKALVSRHE